MVAENIFFFFHSCISSFSCLAHFLAINVALNLCIFKIFELINVISNIYIRRLYLAIIVFFLLLIGFIMFCFVQRWNHWLYFCCVSIYHCDCSSPPFLQWQSDIIRRVVFLERDSLVVFYNISVPIWNLAW